jgi:hypothetical protein
MLVFHSKSIDSKLVVALYQIFSSHFIWSSIGLFQRLQPPGVGIEIFHNLSKSGASNKILTLIFFIFSKSKSVCFNSVESNSKI